MNPSDAVKASQLLTVTSQWCQSHVNPTSHTGMEFEVNSSYNVSTSLSSWDYSGRTYSGAELNLAPSVEMSRRAADRYALLSAVADRRRASRGVRQVGRASAWRRARAAIARPA